MTTCSAFTYCIIRVAIICTVHMFVISTLLVCVVVPLTIDPRCPGDRVYTGCGTLCPTTCDNKDILRSCPAVCIVGECFISIQVHVYMYINVVLITNV